MQRRRFLVSAFAASTAGLLTRVRTAAPQTVARTQIRLIVPFPAGGPSDIVARPFAELLSNALKSVVVVDNRAGAGGTIGADAAARSSPDGRTLFFATVGTHAINPTLYKSLHTMPCAISLRLRLSRKRRWRSLQTWRCLRALSANL
jgi:tripartite-type tricarboxylate transporter receptor subunit TctC